MINLSELSVITQSNVKAGQPSDAQLKKIGTPEKRVAFDLKATKKSGEKTTFVLRSEFMKGQTPDQGWTAAILGDGRVLLVQSTKDYPIVDLQPKFLKTAPGNEFKSDMLEFLLKKGFPELTISETTTVLFLKPEVSPDSLLKFYQIVTENPVADGQAPEVAAPAVVAETPVEVAQPQAAAVPVLDEFEAVPAIPAAEPQATADTYESPLHAWAGNQSVTASEDVLGLTESIPNEDASNWL